MQDASGRFQVLMRGDATGELELFDSQHRVTLATFYPSSTYDVHEEATALRNRLEAEHVYRVRVQAAREVVYARVKDLSEQDVLAAAEAIQAGKRLTDVFQTLFGFRAVEVQE